MEIRTLTQPGKIEGRKLTGIVIPYNADSLDLGGFVERFAPGSVTDTIKSNQIEAWVHHDRSKPLASQSSGTLRLTDTPAGLAYEMDLPEGNSDAANLISLAAAGVVRGASFGFWPTDGGQQWTRENGRNVRTITAATLEHISPVVTPAYPQTSAALRAFGDVSIDPKDFGDIDLDKLAAVLLARAKGLDISDDENKLAERAIALLRPVIKTPRLTAAAERARGMLV